MNSSTKIVVRPEIFGPFTHVAAGQSTRHGGISPAPWDTLNLGKSTEDKPGNVAENRRRFSGVLGFEPAQMAWSKQVHGDQISLIAAAGGMEGYDALVTNIPGILLTVSVADCTPILIFDQKNGVIAAVHAGWKGTAAMVLKKTLDLMAFQYGSLGADCFAYIGTCIDECSFEVGTEVAEQFDSPFKRWDHQRNKYFVDLKKANTAQCFEFGIPEKQLEVSPFSTVLHNEDYFSHRKEGGVTGRMMAGIGIL